MEIREEGGVALALEIGVGGGGGHSDPGNLGGTGGGGVKKPCHPLGGVCGFFLE